MRPLFPILNGITALDLIGVYSPISQLKSADFMPDFNWEQCSFTPKIEDKEKLQAVAERVRHLLSTYELIVIPGEFLTRKKQKDSAFSKWLEICKNRQKNNIGVYKFTITWR
jgi:hypothetical protein